MTKMTFSKKIVTLLIFGFLFFVKSINAQQIDTSIVNYKNPKKFKVAAIEITGTKFLDKNIIRSLTGLKIGDKITVPGDEITKCIKSLWKQGLFGDVKMIC
jgi:outer membrane protein insertion porin family